MFRRSRFSIRPNVGTAGRTAATPQEVPSVNQEASETPKDVGESSTAAAVTDNKSVVAASEKPTASGDGNDQNGDGTSSSAAVQRRKRFSIKPKVAPGRPSALARTPKSPAKSVSETPVEVPVSDLDKPVTSSQIAMTVTPQGLQSPRRRRPSEESRQPKVQSKATLIPSDSSGPSAVPLAEDPKEETDPPADSGKQLESTSSSQVTEVPSRIPDKVPPSLPNKEAVELSERAKTLVSFKSGLSLSPAAYSLSRLLNDPSDLQRLAKARKLRALLREEMHKEKKIKKAKARTKEFTLDPAKMTMRDLIRYLPTANPMSSTLEDAAPENETVVPSSPGREESPERAQEPEVAPKVASPRVEEEEEAADEEEEEALMVPQVKVAEDGTLIIDEESLTVEVQRAKGPNLVQERDPIFERGSTTTYSSFRKGTYSKPWTSEETDMFFLAISMVGTDFSMICQLFPHRARSEIKNKFKKEERENAWRIDKAFRERRKLDIEYFSKLLEKILEVQKTRKKLRSVTEKNSPKKHKRKAKGKKAAKKLSDVEEEDEEEDNDMPDLEEEEGEKENEDLGNEGGTPASKPKKKRKRKTKQDESTEEPNNKKKAGEKSNEQDEAYIPEDAEAALPEDQTNSDMSEKTDNVDAAKNTTIKPAKLTRGRAPKPLLPLGRKWGKKLPPPSTKMKDNVSDKEGESVSDGASTEQGNNDASPIRQANKKKSANDDISSEEEDSTIQPPKPTRYGRVPKPTKPLNYPAKDDAPSSAPETTPASPAGSTASAARPKPKCTAKRGRSSKTQSTQESKKPKLVTLRASQSEYSDDENEKQWEDDEVEEEQQPGCSSSKDGIAPAFVPASLRSPQPVISEVEETMEELDILANMPDVLGISQDALCPDASCELAQNETGTAEPCEHQLDLLVDVIDFLSSEHTEVSEDESYNEAAQTLLTIGNLAHLSQSAQNQTAVQDHTTGTASVSVDESSQHLEVEITLQPAVQEENGVTPIMSATSGQAVTETSETVVTVELQNSTPDSGDMPITETSEQGTGSDIGSTPQLQSSPERPKTDSPQTRRGRLSKVKPKPNLSQASRTAESKSQPETSTVGTVEERPAVAPDLSQATATVMEETPKIADCSQKSSKDEISCTEGQLTEEPYGGQEVSAGKVKSGSATSEQSALENQSHCFSDNKFEPTLEQATRESTDKILMSHIGTTKSSDNLVTSDTAVTELRGSNINSAPAKESSDQPAPCIIPVEDLPTIQKEESEEASTSQTRRSRFQKVKPKPNLPQTSRTVRSKPQTTKDTIEKDPSPAPYPKFHEKTIVEVEAESTCTTSSEKSSQRTGPSSDWIPSMDLGTAVAPTEELSTAEEENLDVRDVGQVESGATTSTDEKLMSCEGTTESSCSNPLTSDLAVSESQVGQGSNIDLALVQESSDHPVTPVEDLPAGQKEESEDASSCQTRKSRFQKAKPKPNLTQTSRTARSKPQTTKNTVENDSNPTPNLRFHGKTIIEVEAESTCTTSSEKPSQSTGSASDFIPSLDLGSTLTPTEELSKTEEEKTDVGVVGQVESGPATSDQCSSESQNFSEAQFEPISQQATRDTRPTSESTEEKLISHVGTTESSCNKPLKSDSVVPESQIGQQANIDTAPVQQSSDHPVPCVAAVEDLSGNQNKESQDESTSQTRKSRFQRVKPKPNLPQTSRIVWSKPQTTKDTVEKDSNPTPNTKLYKRTIEVEAEPTSATSAEKPSQNTGPASDLKPSLDLASTLTPTEELFTTEEKKTDVGVVVQVESGAAASDESASENQNTRPTSESDSAVSESQLGQGSSIDSAPVQESGDHPASCVSNVEDVPVSQKEESEDASTSQTRKSRFQRVKPKPNLPQTSRTVRSKPQTTKDPVTHMQLVEKPSSPNSKRESTDNTVAEVEANLPTCCSTPPGEPSQIKSTATASVSAPSLEFSSTHKPPQELSSTEGQKTDVGNALDSSSESSEQNISQRRRRFPKVKPNLGASTRTAQTKLQASDLSNPAEQQHMDISSNVTSEQQPVDNNDKQPELKLAEKDSKDLTSTHCTELLSSTKLGSAESEKSRDDKNDKGTTSVGIIIATSSNAEYQPVLTDSLKVLENKSSEKCTVEGESTAVEAGTTSQWDCKQDMSIRTTETNTQPADDLPAVSDVQSSEDVSLESKIKSVYPTNTQSTPHPKEITQQPRSENDSEIQSQDAIQQCSDTNQTAPQSTNDTESESTDSSKLSRKAPPPRRGRLVKPKPNLGRSSRPPQPQQVQNTKQAEADSDIHSEVVGPPVSHKPVAEPDIQEPIEGAIEQSNNQNSPSNAAGSSMGCLMQVIEQVSDNSTQDASTPNTGETQSHPGLTVFTDMLPEQVPSDPDEQYFILSLTEIPVCPSGEVVDSASEPLPYLPVPDASMQQQSSVPGEGLPAGGDGPLSSSVVSVSMEESGERSLIDVKDIGPDPAVHIQGSVMENPVDPHEITTVQPSISPDTVENDDETEPPAKQRLMGRGRASKLQVKPEMQKRKQASKTLATKEVEFIQDSELPGPFVQPEASDEVITEPQKGSGDHVDTEKEVLTGVKDSEDTSSGAQTKRTRTSVRNRNAKSFPSFLSETKGTAPSSDSAPDKAASKGPKVKTSHTAGKPSTQEPVASTSTHSTHCTTSPTQAVVDIEQTSEHGQLCPDTTPSISPYPAEVSASQQSDSVESSCIEEEPTNVSQYFFSDIFTEVEEKQKSESDPSFDSETNNTAPSSDSQPSKATSKGPQVKTPCAAGKQPTQAFLASTPCLAQQAKETLSTPSSTTPTQEEVDIKQTSEHSGLCSDPAPASSPCIAELSATQKSDCEDEPTSVSQYFLSDIFTDVEKKGKRKGSTSLLSETNNTAPSSASQPAKAASKGPKDKAPHIAGKRSLRAPVASTSYDVASTPNPAQMAEETPVTSLTTSPTQDTNTAPSSNSPPARAASKGPKGKTQRAAGKRSTRASDNVAPTPNPTQPSEETNLTSSTTSPTQAEVDMEQTSEPSRLCSDPTPGTSPCTAEGSASKQSDGLDSSLMEEEPTSVSQYFLSDIFTEVEEDESHREVE
ncbi:uncharacterized protein ABDE67_018246 [Symphorus nematophorus]